MGDASHEWAEDANNQWHLRICGVHVWIAERPQYCDRGHYQAQVDDLPSIDHQDGFPRYYMNLERAKSEMHEWLLWRLLSEKEHGGR